MRTIRIGTRDSRLAIIQAEIVAKEIKRYDAGIETQLVMMKTTGDRILDVSLDKIGGKGLFVKELDEALLSESVDITVHSYKDMPVDVNPNLPIVGLSKREDPRDVMILRKDIKKASPQLVVGCSSKRRIYQLRDLGYHNTKPLRGNVITRLKKLNDGEYDAIVLAAAGLKRLGMEHVIDRYFSVQEIIPSACQGVLAVQARLGDDVDYLAGFRNADSEFSSSAERAFIRTLDGGCSSPMAAYATIEQDRITLTGLYVDEQGRTFKDTILGSSAQAEELGRTLASKMKASSI